VGQKRTSRSLAALSIVLVGCSSASREPATAELTKAVTSSLSTVSVTQGADELRTSWYPDEPGLTPSVVSSSNFGQLFSTPVTGAVYAQPLVSQGTLFVATEQDYVYGLNPQTGGINWSQSLGSPVAASDIGCGLDPLLRTVCLHDLS